MERALNGERAERRCCRSRTRPQPEPASGGRGAPSRDGGNGAGALPFQLSETREHPEARLTPYEPPQPTPVEEAIPEYEALRANARARGRAAGQRAAAQGAGGCRRALRGAARPAASRTGCASNVTADGEPVLPRPAHDDDVDDGLSGVGGEDLSEIPEHMR
jgi:hypothetical protein